MCKRFSLDKFCKFGGECAYRHPPDRNEEVQKLSAKNELEISVAEHVVVGRKRNSDGSLK